MGLLIRLFASLSVGGHALLSQAYIVVATLWGCMSFMGHGVGAMPGLRSLPARSHIRRLQYRRLAARGRVITDKRRLCFDFGAAEGRQ